MIACTAGSGRNSPTRICWPRSSPGTIARLLARWSSAYGPLVWSVCRRQLRENHAAEDATQTTFLTLIRQAQARAAGVLGRVAGVCRPAHARKARLAESRRRQRETAAAATSAAVIPDDDLSVRELLARLDEELTALPQRYQSALLTCYWRGVPQTAAARQMGITPAALKGLLERGRAKLLARLRQRGLTADVALRGLLVAPLALAAVPDDLLAHRRTVSRAGPAVAALAARGRSHPLGATAAALALGIGLILVPGATPQGPVKSRPAAAEVKPKARPRVDALGDALPEAALLRLGTERFKHPNDANALALSPDGKIVVTDGSRQLIAWDVATGKQLWAKAVVSKVGMGGSYAGENSLAFSPDGKRLITPALGNAFAVWDIATGEHRLVPLKDVPAAAQEKMTAVDVAPDGESVVVGTSAGVILTDFEGNVRKQIPRLGGGRRDPNDRLLFHDEYSFALLA